LNYARCWSSRDSLHLPGPLCHYNSRPRLWLGRRLAVWYGPVRQKHRSGLYSESM